MSQSNLPILYRNIMDGLPAEAHTAFLWATERPENDMLCYWAEAYARESAKLSVWFQLLMRTKTRAAIRSAASGTAVLMLTEDQETDLAVSFADRHANLKCGGNVRARYARAIAEGRA